MSLSYNKESPLAISIIFSILCVALVLVCAPKFRFLSADTEITLNHYSQIQLKTPDKDQISQINIEVKPGLFGTNQLYLRPDDCIINVSLDNDIIYSSESNCSWPKGQLINFPETIYDTSRLSIDLKNKGGPSGIQFGMGSSDRLWTLLYCSILILLISLRFIFKSSNDFIFIYIITAGLLLRVFYFSITPYWIRQVDLEDHLQFIHYVFNKWAIPQIYMGKETHQAPLYYIISGFLLEITKWSGSNYLNAAFYLQLFSFVTEFTALGFILNIIRSAPGIMKKRFLAESIALAVCIFPGLIYLSPRISNDGLFYAFSIASLYYLKLACNFPADRKFWHYALAFSILAFLTKITGLIIICAVFLFQFVIFKHDINQIPIKRGLITLAAVFITTFWFIDYRFINNKESKPDKRFYLPDHLLVANTITEYVTFRPEYMMYFDSSVSLDKRTYEERNFWETFIRSSLFGSYEFGRKFLTSAKYLTYSALALYLFGTICLFVHFDIFTVIFSLFFIALLYYRWSEPYCCNQDFRFIAPIVLPFILGLLKNKWIKVTCLLVLLFNLSQLWFWLSMLAYTNFS